jgi:hypothetical protein
VANDLKSVLLQGTGQGNVFGKTSDEELQKLAKDKKVPTPTSPAEAAAIGANPDQSKMAGASANLKSTLQQAAPSPDGEEAAPTTSLRDTLRHEQSRKALTTAEQTQQQLQAKLQTGGADFTSEAAGAAAQNAFTGLTIEKAILKIDTDGKYAWLGDDESAKENIAKLMTGGVGVDFTALAAMKGPNGETFATWPEDDDALINKVKAIFGDTTAQVAQAGAEAVIDYDNFGIEAIYGDDSEAKIQELADSLGIPIEELQGMNMTQIQESLTATIQEEYSRTENLFEQATDSTLSPAERAEARKLAKDLGATGIASMELTDVDQLADQMEDADTINIGEGDDVESITVEYLLNDEFITGLIANHLDGDKTATDQLEKRGDLLDFVTKNNKAFEELLSGVDKSVGAFTAIQTTNKAEAADLTNIFGADTAKMVMDLEGNSGLSGFSNALVEIAALDSLNAKFMVDGLTSGSMKFDIAKMTKEQIDSIFGSLEPADSEAFIASSNFAGEVLTSNGNPATVFGEDWANMEAGMNKINVANDLKRLGFPINVSDSAQSVAKKMSADNWITDITSNAAKGVDQIGQANLTTKASVVSALTEGFELPGIAANLAQPGMMADGKITNAGINELAGMTSSELDNIISKNGFQDPNQVAIALGPQILNEPELQDIFSAASGMDSASLLNSSNPEFGSWQGIGTTGDADYHGGAAAGLAAIGTKLTKLSTQITSLQNRVNKLSGVKKLALENYINQLTQNRDQLNTNRDAYKTRWEKRYIQGGTLSDKMAAWFQEKTEQGTAENENEKEDKK